MTGRLRRNPHADQVTQLDDPVCNHGGALERAPADRRIKAFRHQIDQAFAEVDLELYLGVGLDEIHRERHDQFVADRGRRGDLELAARGWVDGAY